MAEKEGVTISKERLEKMLDSLREIEAITRGLVEFNHTYEKIHKIASEG